MPGEEILLADYKMFVVQCCVVDSLAPVVTMAIYGLRLRDA